jgi:hypothetical protein
MTVWAADNTSLGTISSGSVNTWTVTIGGTYTSQGMTAATIGASAPTSSDNVFFTTTSGGAATYNVNPQGASAADVTIVAPTGGAFVLLTAFDSSLNVYGSWSSAATGVSFNTTSGATLNFLATSTGKTISTNNVSLGAMAVTFNGVGGGWTLTSNFTVTTVATTLTAGALNTGGFTFNGLAISSSGTGVRSLTLGSSTLTLSGTSPWVLTTTTNLTFSGASSIIQCSSTTTSTFAGGSLTYGTVSFTSGTATTISFTGVNTFTNLSFTTRTTDGIQIISFGGNQTVSGTLTFGTTNTAVRRMSVQSSTQWTQRTLTVGTIATLSDIDFQDIVAAGASGTWSGTRIADCKNNSNITFTTAKTVYLSSTSGANTNWSGICWANTSNGTPDVVNFPLAQDTAIIDDAGTTAGNGLRTGYTITFNSNWNIGTLTSTRAAAYTFSQGNQDPQIFGNLTLSSGLTFVGLTSPTIQFAGYGNTQTITTNGKTIRQQNIAVNSPGGTVRLLDALTLTFTPTSTSSSFTLTAGTLDLNGFTLTPNSFTSTGSVARTLAFGSTGKIVTTGGAASGSQTVFTTSTSTNLTVTGSANVECYLPSSYLGTTGIRTIAPGLAGGSETNVLNISITGGGVDTVVISDTGKFRDLNTSGQGAGGALSLGGTFTSYGNVVLGTGTTVTVSSLAGITYASTSGTKTITTNGVSFPKDFTFDGIGGTWEIQDALTYQACALTLVNGTVKLKSGTIYDFLSVATSGTNQKYLQSITPGANTTIRIYSVYSTGLNDTLTFNYLTLQDINANTTPDTTIWYAGANSISNGNVTGWTFTRGEFLQMF